MTTTCLQLTSISLINNFYLISVLLGVYLVQIVWTKMYQLSSSNTKICEIAENSPIGTVACSFKLEGSKPSYQFIMLGGFFLLKNDTAGSGKIDLVTKTSLDRESLFSTGKCQDVSKIERELASEITDSLRAGCWLPARIPFRDPMYHDQISTLSYQKLWIVVTDMNDNVPKFHRSKFYLDVQEESEEKSLTFNLPLAEDDDALENSTITYYLRANESIFKLLHHTSDKDTSSQPKLQILQRLNRENCLGYNLALVAVDGRGLNSTLPIVLRLVDINDNPPIIQLSQEINSAKITVLESDRPGKILTKISAYDPDDVLSKSERERKLSYQLATQGCDYLPTESNLRTLFLQQPTTTQEIRSNSVVLLKFDKTTNVQLLQLFSLTPDGTLSLKSSLDFEKLAQNMGEVIEQGWIDFELPIIAEDNGKPALTTSTSVIIRLLDENDNDPVIMIEKFEQQGLHEKVETNQLYVPENSPPNTQIAMILVTDEDFGRNGEISCKLEDAQSSIDFQQQQTALKKFGHTSEYFTLVEDHEPLYPRSRTYTLMTNTKLIDREERSSLHVKLTCVDGNNVAPRRTSQIISIQIFDNNDNSPQFHEKLIRVKTKEGQINRLHIGDIIAKDRDVGTNARTFYRLVKSNDSHNFELDATSGALYGIKPLDREIRESMELKVEAFDLTELLRLNGQKNPTDQNEFNIDTLHKIADKILSGEMQTSLLPAEVTVLIEIEDINDNPPIFIEPLSFELFEGESRWIGKLQATDPDQGINAKFHFGLSFSSIFETLPNGISLSTRNLTQAQLCSTLNKMLPSPEEMEFKQVCLWRLHADGNLYGDSSFKLDREKQEIYHLPVVVTDEGKPALSTTATIEIRLLDQNDSRPKFLFPPSSGLLGGNGQRYLDTPETRLNVSMDTPDGTIIAKIDAFDADLGENARIIYAIQSQSVYAFANPVAKGWNISFSIDPDTGDLRFHRSYQDEASSDPMFQRRFDKAIQMSFRLTLSAKDNGQQPMVEFTTLCIDIVDKNFIPTAHAKARFYNTSVYADERNWFFDQGMISRDLVLGLATSLVLLVIIACVALLVIVLATNKRSRVRNNQSIRSMYDHYDVPRHFTNSLALNTTAIFTDPEAHSPTKTFPTNETRKNNTNDRFTLPKWLRLGPKTRSRPMIAQSISKASHYGRSRTTQRTNPDNSAFTSSLLVNNKCQSQNPYIGNTNTSDYASDDITQTLQLQESNRWNDTNNSTRNFSSDRVVYHWMRNTSDGLFSSSDEADEHGGGRFGTLKISRTPETQQILMLPNEDYTRLLNHQKPESLGTFTPKTITKRAFNVNIDPCVKLSDTGFAEKRKQLHTFLTKD